MKLLFHVIWYLILAKNFQDRCLMVRCLKIWWFLTFENKYRWSFTSIDSLWLPGGNGAKQLKKGVLQNEWFLERSQMLFLPLLRFTPGAPRKANPPKLERSNQIRLFIYTKQIFIGIYQKSSYYKANKLVWTRSQARSLHFLQFFGLLAHLLLGFSFLGLSHSLINFLLMWVHFHKSSDLG